MVQEFKEFLLRGNVIDLAVAVVIGAAFAAIIDALVVGIIGPLIALIVGQPDFSAWTTTIGGTEFGTGLVIQAVFSFVTVGLVLFFFIKAVNKAMESRKEPENEGEAEVPEDVLVLREIRDALRTGR